MRHLPQIVLVVAIFAISFISTMFKLDAMILLIVSLPILFALLKVAEKKAKECEIVLRDERDVYIDMWASSLTLKIGIIIGLISYLMGIKFGIEGLEYVLYFSLLLIFIRWVLLIIGRRKF